MKNIHYLCSGEAVKDDSELSDHECLATKKTCDLSQATRPSNFIKNFKTLQVIREGFEPSTPTLKVLCSTN